MKSQLEDLTYLEFRERLKDDPVILIPLGSQEEQGPSAPMGDFMLTKELARRVAEKTGAIATPTVPFGYADFFRPIPGGVQLSAGTFKHLLRDLLDNFLAHGLTKLLIFNGHTGNSPLIDQVVRTVKRETGVVVLFEGLEVNAPVDVTDHTRNGIVSGDATLASAEAGRLFSEYIVERTANLVDYLKTIKQSRESNKA